MLRPKTFLADTNLIKTFPIMRKVTIPKKASVCRIVFENHWLLQRSTRPKNPLAISTTINTSISATMITAGGLFLLRGKNSMVAASTGGRLALLAMLAAQNLVAALQGKLPPNLINPEARR